ncbi:hypothetical protein [Virgibacillus salexigens]|nr:hypothetical protein [Virgibacillus massiliensis]
MLSKGRILKLCITVIIMLFTLLLMFSEKIARWAPMMGGPINSF